MSVPVDFLPAAYHDLESLVDHFSGISEELGRRFIVAVRDSVDRLGDHPEIGGRCEFEGVSLPELRAWPVQGFRRYLLIYQSDADAVRIIRRLDGTSDWANYLADRPV